jgi:hypothetical protein
MEKIFAITILLILNAVSVLNNYKYKNYKSAIISAFCFGMLFIALIKSIIQ